MTSDKSTVLLTGGSKGIGLAIAMEFAKYGHSLVLVARNEKTLQRAHDDIKRIHPVDILTISLDLAQHTAPQQLFERLEKSDLSIDIIINNAGMGLTGLFIDNDHQALQNMMQLNVHSLTAITHLFMPAMIERGAGQIINIGSLVAYFPGAPNWASYVATKHYVRAFTLGLARELRGTGVSATLVSPGATATDFVKTASAGDMRVYRLPVGLPVERIAQITYRANRKGKVSVIPGVMNKTLAFMGELHPRAIAFEVFAFLSRKT